MLQKEHNRKGHFGDKVAKEFVRVIIEALHEQLEGIEQEIKERMDKD